MTVRTALPLLLMLAACSKHDAPAPADAGPAAVMMAMPSGSAPSPFTVEGAARPVDAERFPAKVAALAWETRVLEQPSASSKVLGYVRAGGLVLAGNESTRGDGCRGDWRAVAPVGYVCVEAGNATLDADATMVNAGCNPGGGHEPL